MRKVSLVNYTVRVWKEDGKRGVDEFNVRENLIDLCFIPAKGCTAAQVLERQRLARKIAQAHGDEVLLEDAEWQRLREAIDAVGALGYGQAELVERIVDAPTVKVVEKPEPRRAGLSK